MRVLTISIVYRGNVGPCFTVTNVIYGSPLLKLDPTAELMRSVINIEAFGAQVIYASVY